MVASGLGVGEQAATYESGLQLSVRICGNLRFCGTKPGSAGVTNRAIAIDESPVFHPFAMCVRTPKAA